MHTQHVMKIEIRNSAGRVLFSSGTVDGLAGIDLAGVDLAGADLKGANLMSSKLMGAKLMGANLEGATLTRACLAYADLKGASLKGAYLPDANLEGANLTYTDLKGASLKGASLKGAYLLDANLMGANLEGVNFESADLEGTNLEGANLTRANICKVLFTGCLLAPEQLDQLALRIPCVEGLDQKVLDVITVEGGRLDMSRWHGSDQIAAICGSTHCRAGWAIHLAGAEGYALESAVSAATAGALIYLKSTGQPVPDFLSSNASAMADIQHRAQRAALPRELA